MLIHGESGMKRKNAPRVHFSLLVLCYLEVRLPGWAVGRARGSEASFSNRGRKRFSSSELLAHPNRARKRKTTRRAHLSGPPRPARRARGCLIAISL